ncbi:Clp protease N-terminal domain-containing protein [Streptomyces sp. NPDC005438]|uniref:Clp protease N-terminal domain-containing protein n=1 Tax=Streptomyces sp. NPDC005438 TaxID=3156880 RepID=UPI0033ADA356
MRSLVQEAEGRPSPALPSLSPELAAAVLGARRRAARGADPQIDTAHLLHSLLESDQGTRESLSGDEPARLGRLLGYLVQRSIGYGLVWQTRAEGPEAQAETWWGGVSGWSPKAAAALNGALVRARLRRAEYATGRDLMAALLADPECRAVEVLRSAGLDPMGETGRMGERAC